MSYRRRISIGDGCGWLPLLIWGVIWIYALGFGLYSCVTRTGQFADVVTIKITNNGFDPQSVQLSPNEILHVVNASSRPVTICIGHKQVCSNNASSNKATPIPATTPTVETMPTGGLTIPPGKSYDLSFKRGNYGLTITIGVGVVFTSTDLGVTAQGDDNSAVSSEDESSGVSVSTGGDDEGSGGSGSGTGSGGGDDGGGSSGGGGDGGSGAGGGGGDGGGGGSGGGGGE